MNWVGLPVLVTGPEYFIGSHRAEALVRVGAEVQAFCVCDSTEAHSWLGVVGVLHRAVPVR